MTAENVVEILAKSSSGEPYTVTFYLRENSISAVCSCPGGDYRMLCKHVKCLVDGDDSVLYDSRQRRLLQQIGSHLQKTTIPRLLSELNDAEALLTRARQNARKAKKNLEKVILQR